MSDRFYYDRTGYVVIIPKSGNNAQSVTIRNLRFTFEIKRTLTSDTNNPDISVVKIYNLSESTRNKIDEPDQFVQVFAGYNEAEGAKLIYSGDIIDISKDVESINNVTAIQAQDGGRSIRDQKISVAYGANTNVKQILKDAVNSLGIPVKLPIDKLNIPNIKITNSESFTGNSKTLIDKYAAKAGFQWTVINGEVALIPIEAADNSRSVFLSSKTGMIGTPKKISIKVGKENRAGWEVASLLQPNLQIGGPLVVDSVVVNSNAPFKILELYHSGDTHGGSWTSKSKVVSYGS